MTVRNSFFSVRKVFRYRLLWVGGLVDYYGNLPSGSNLPSRGTPAPLLQSCQVRMARPWLR